MESLPSGQGRRTIPKLDQLTGRAQNCIGVADMDYDTVMMQVGKNSTSQRQSPLPCQDNYKPAEIQGQTRWHCRPVTSMYMRQFLLEYSSPLTRRPSMRACRLRQLGQCGIGDHLEGKRRVHGQILTETTERLQPLQHPLKKNAVPHQHRLVGINVVMIVTIMTCSRWQDSKPTSSCRSTTW